MEGMVGTTQEKQVEKRTVVDTGAGPNLIRAELLPDEILLKLLCSREVVNLSSAYVLVSCSRAGTCFTETGHTIYDKNLVASANGIDDIREGFPFALRLASFFKLPRVLAKRQILGVAVLSPETILKIKMNGPPNSLNKTEKPSTPTSDTAEGHPCVPLSYSVD